MVHVMTMVVQNTPVALYTLWPIIQTSIIRTSQYSKFCDFIRSLIEQILYDLPYFGMLYGVTTQYFILISVSAAVFFVISRLPDAKSPKAWCTSDNEGSNPRYLPTMKVCIMWSHVLITRTQPAQVWMTSTHVLPRQYCTSWMPCPCVFPCVHGLGFLHCAFSLSLQHQLGPVHTLFYWV